MNAIVVFDPKSSFNSIGVTGTIAFHQCSPDHPTKVTFNLSNLPPMKTRALHIHKNGDLTRGCDSTCSHYSPDPKQLHGSKKLSGLDRHPGDLMNNITPDKDGNVKFVWVDELVDLFPPFSVIGRAIVIHEGVDDLGQYWNERDDKGNLTERAKGSGTTGNAGKRVACALIGITDEGCK